MSTQSNRLKVAVVGASIVHSVDARENFAIRAHLPALQALPDLFEVVAVCTTRQESADEAAQRFGVPHAFDSVERMLVELPEIDVVCVSVKPAAHYEVSIAALRAGKHVYVEHPGGISTVQAREMWETAQQNKLRTITGHQDHFDASALHMMELVRQGYVGTPLVVSASHFGPNYITPRPYFHRWLFDVSAGGRPAYRSGHGLERIMAVLGEDVTSVCADFTIKVPERPALDQPDMMLTSNQVDNMNYLLRVGDTVGTLQVSNTAWGGIGDWMHVYGTDGMLLLADRDGVASLGPRGADADQSFSPLQDFALFGYQAQVDRILEEKRPPEELGELARIPVPDPEFPESVTKRAVQRVAIAWTEFAAAINEGRECSPSLYESYKIHCIWDAAERSVENRAWVDVDYS